MVEIPRLRTAYMKKPKRSFWAMVMLASDSEGESNNESVTRRLVARKGFS